jgi:hypothetical protein
MSKGYWIVTCTVALALVAFEAAYTDHQLSPDFRDTLQVVVSSHVAGELYDHDDFAHLEATAETTKDMDALKEMRRLRELDEQTNATAAFLARTNCTFDCAEWIEAVKFERTRNMEREVLTASVRQKAGLPPE